MSDEVLQILKYGTSIMTAVMAILAFRTKPKDDSGRFTKLGWLYFALLMIFHVGTLLTQYEETRRQKRSSEEQLKRHENLIEQVIRGQYPLYNVRASYQLRMPTDLSGLGKYEQRLNGSMSQISQQLSSAKYRQANDIRIAMVHPQVSILFCQNSPLMPSVTAEPDAARIVGALNVRVLMYRRPVQPEQWPLFVVTGTNALQPDVEMWFSGGDRCIEYSVHDRQLILRDIGAATNPSQWQSSGKILSVKDLEGAQMIVDVHPRMTDQFQGQLLLDDFELFVGSLQALWLPKDRFTRHRLPNGDVTYEFVFPETLEEILALQRRYGK